MTPLTMLLWVISVCLSVLAISFTIYLLTAIVQSTVIGYRKGKKVNEKTK